MQQRERSSPESYFWPTIWAVGLHVLIFALLFVSFSMTPELPPSRPIVQATLYQLKSQSQATVQTSQKIAGEAQKTAAPQYETEQMEQKKVEQQRVAAAKAAEQKKAEQAKAAEAQKQKEAAAAKAKADAEKKAAEQKQLADIARKKAAEEAAKKKAEQEAAKKKAAEDAKKKLAEEAKKKAAEDARKKAAAEAAQKKAAEQAAARKAQEDKKAAALAELLADDVQRQQALGDSVGKPSGSLDDLIINLVSQQWRRPPSARQGMSVTILIQMLPDGTITSANVTRSSGDAAFDSSAVAAVRNVGRVPEVQTMVDRATFDQFYRRRAMIFKPEDLSL